MNDALNIAQFGDRWEVTRETDGVRRRIGILHHREDAEMLVAAPELLGAVGCALDRIDNLLAALKLPFPQDIHLRGLRSALPEIREELNTVFVKAGGES